MRLNHPVDTGAAIARLLRGAWRVEPAGVVATRDLNLAAKLLPHLGAGSLAWWQLRRSSLAQSTAAQNLRAGYQLHVLQAARAAQRVRVLADLLHGAGLRALLIKGFAVAQRYPQPALRPYGDNDLWVAPQDVAAVRQLTHAAQQALYVDLHTEFAGFADRSFQQLWERSVALDGVAGAGLRTLGAEDHLRLLGMHLLRHGASRPAWLCDVALFLETLPPEFDWDLCLGDVAPAHDWLQAIFGLCVQLLGAHPGNAPWLQAPCWLCDAVLGTWGGGLGEATWGANASALALWREPATVWRGMRQRWPNAMQAAVDLGEPLHTRAPPFAASRVFLRRGGRWLVRRARASAVDE